MQSIIKERKRALGVLYHKILDIPPQAKQAGRDLILKADVVKLIIDAFSS